MNLRRLNGYRVLYQARPGVCRKPRTKLPRGQHFYYLRVAEVLLFLHWLPREGLALRTESFAHSPDCPYKIYPWRYKEPGVKKREKLGLAGGNLPGAPSASVILSKCPTVREYITAKSYDNGDPREVSVLRITTRGTQWQFTLTDPDYQLRLPVQASECDKGLLLLEALLQAPDAPWEHDPYAKEVKAKKGKK